MRTRVVTRLGQLCCLVSLFGILGACGGAANRPATAVEPVFSGLGTHRRTVDTSSTEAQTFFDQGLAFVYAFNHDEAIRSFQRAAELDPKCAMAQWGIAYANGPHINNAVVPPEREAAGFAAAGEAVRLAQSLDDGPNRALIEAVATRYASPQPSDRAPLDQAFADAMAEAYRRFPEDGDVGALYAEALLDLHPWDLWTHAGEPKEWTPEIVALLEEVLERHPAHPLALHLYIHAVEASSEPGRRGPGRRRPPRPDARPRPHGAHAVAHRRPSRPLGGGDRRQHQGHRGRPRLPRSGARAAGLLPCSTCPTITT